MYDRTTAQGATFNMRGQLHRVLVLAWARCCALETCGKKMRAPLLGLAKSIYYTKIKTEKAFFCALPLLNSTMLFNEASHVPFQ